MKRGIRETEHKLGDWKKVKKGIPGKTLYLGNNSHQTETAEYGRDST